VVAESESFQIHTSWSDEPLGSACIDTAASSTALSSPAAAGAPVPMPVPDCERHLSLWPGETRSESIRLSVSKLRSMLDSNEENKGWFQGDFRATVLQTHSVATFPQTSSGKNISPPAQLSTSTSSAVLLDFAHALKPTPNAEVIPPVAAGVSCCTLKSSTASSSFVNFSDSDRKDFNTGQGSMMNDSPVICLEVEFQLDPVHLTSSAVTTTIDIEIEVVTARDSTLQLIDKFKSDACFNDLGAPSFGSNCGGDAPSALIPTQSRVAISGGEIQLFSRSYRLRLFLRKAAGVSALSYCHMDTSLALSTIPVHERQRMEVSLNSLLKSCNELRRNDFVIAQPLDKENKSPLKSMRANRFCMLPAQQEMFLEVMFLLLWFIYFVPLLILPINNFYGRLQMTLIGLYLLEPHKSKLILL
jgi:hypothetical protein